MCWAFVTQRWTEGLGCALLPLGLKSGSDAVCFDFTLVVKDLSAKNIEGDHICGCRSVIQELQPSPTNWYSLFQ